MKKILILALMLGAFSLNAADAPKPFPASLKNCVVSGDKIGGDMGKPYVFTYEGQEVKLCCKDCVKDFKKDPAKFMKVINEAAAKK